MDLTCEKDNKWTFASFEIVLVGHVNDLVKKFFLLVDPRDIFFLLDVVLDGRDSPDAGEKPDPRVCSHEDGAEELVKEGVGRFWHFRHFVISALISVLFCLFQPMLRSYEYSIL